MNDTPVRFSIDLSIYPLSSGRKGSSIARSRWFRKRVSRSIPTSNTVNTWLNSGASGQEPGEKRLLPGVAGQMDISFSVSVDHWQNVAFGRSLRSLVEQRNSRHLSVPTICAIPLPKHSLIRLPMDWIARRCHSQPFSSCWAMPISRPRRSIHGFLLMILPG